jgi:hypothetical protein
MNIDELERLFHPVPEHQDAACPEIKWMGEDLGHCPGIGEHKCLLQGYHHGEYDQNQDYHACNNSDHNACAFYLRHHGDAQ